MAPFFLHPGTRRWNIDKDVPASLSIRYLAYTIQQTEPLKRVHIL
jgi:hypothetical protein